MPRTAPARARRKKAAPSPGPEQRLEAIIAAAVRVFLQRSYRRAQMADVARELGISAGNLYNYVESKEALFHLVALRGFGGPEDAAPQPLPVPTPAPGETLALLRRRLGAEVVPPSLEAALTRKRVADPRRELEVIVRELYANVARKRKGIVLLERSAHDWPELAALFYVGMRRELLARLARYLRARMDAGLLRRVPDPALAARFVNETIAWFAMHRFGDPDSKDVDPSVCEDTVVDLVVHALAKE
jgi:AcrR family transcriptional regulator